MGSSIARLEGVWRIYRLGRALAGNPKILLADEPTGNLDLESKRRVMELMRMANGEYGTTVIVVTHDSLVAGYAGRVLRIADGVVKQL